jgi:transposase
MHTVTTIGLDIAKSVFQVHGVDAAGQVVIRRQLKRRYLLAFFRSYQHAWSASRPAPRRTTGRASSSHLAILCV